MRFLGVIFTLCLITGAITETVEEKKERFNQIRDFCKEVNGIDDDLIQKLKSGEQEHFDQKLKCYSACVFKYIGLMTLDGAINEDVARSKISAHVSDEETEQILNQCRTPAGEDHCEVAGKIMHCLAQTKVVSIFE